MSLVESDILPGGLEGAPTPLVIVHRWVTGPLTPATFVRVDPVVDLIGGSFHQQTPEDERESGVFVGRDRARRLCQHTVEGEHRHPDGLAAVRSMEAIVALYYQVAAYRGRAGDGAVAAGGTCPQRDE